jgi:hypothetical protein
MSKIKLTNNHQCIQIWVILGYTHMSVLQPFPTSVKFTPMVFQDSPGWPFSPQLKWINGQILQGHAEIV